MAQRHGSAWCAHCAKQVMTVSDGAAHLVHGLIVLLGLLFYWPIGLLWLFV